MPTVLSVFGLRVVIDPSDHRPAHVHVLGNGCEAVFKLVCPSGPPALRENHGFARQELTRIIRALQEHLELLCQTWSKMHGCAD